MFIKNGSNSGAGGCSWADALDEVDVTIAERRPLDALGALRRLEKAALRPPPASPDPLHPDLIAYGARACMRALFSVQKAPASSVAASLLMPET